MRGSVHGLTELPEAQWLEFSRTAALLLLLVHRASGLLLEHARPDIDFAVHHDSGWLSLIAYQRGSPA